MISTIIATALIITWTVILYLIHKSLQRIIEQNEQLLGYHDAAARQTEYLASIAHNVAFSAQSLNRLAIRLDPPHPLDSVTEETLRQPQPARYGEAPAET